MVGKKTLEKPTCPTPKNPTKRDPPIFVEGFQKMAKHFVRRRRRRRKIDPFPGDHVDMSQILVVPFGTAEEAVVNQKMFVNSYNSKLEPACFFNKMNPT